MLVNIHLRLRKINPNLPTPQYMTDGAAGMDLYAAATVVFHPGEMHLVPLGVAVEIPEGYFGLVAPRSSLFKRKGLLMANSIGIIDSDYRGDDDQIHAALYLPKDSKRKVVMVEEGERICQLLILPVARATIEVVESLGNPSRGGFGSTGTF